APKTVDLREKGYVKNDVK
nr:acid thiol protease=cathepsin L homolog {N-terminal} [Xenopus, embryos, Peptide Partial, 18 aa] [Xenopus]